MLNELAWELPDHLNGSHSHSLEQFDETISTGHTGVSMVQQTTVISNENLAHRQPSRRPLAHHESLAHIGSDSLMRDQLFQPSVKVGLLEKQLASPQPSFLDHARGLRHCRAKIDAFEERIKRLELKQEHSESLITQLLQRAMREPVENQPKAPISININDSQHRDARDAPSSSASRESLRIPTTPPELVYSGYSLEHATFGCDFSDSTAMQWIDTSINPYSKELASMSMFAGHMSIDSVEGQLDGSIITGNAMWPTMDDIAPRMSHREGELS
jgi:hypothetical protein